MITKFKLFEKQEKSLTKFVNLIYGKFTYTQDEKRPDQINEFLKTNTISQEELNDALKHVSLNYNVQIMNTYFHIISHLIKAGANPNEIYIDLYGDGKLIVVMYNRLNVENFMSHFMEDIILHLMENGMEWTTTQIKDTTLEKRIEEMFPDDYKVYKKNMNIKKFKI